jgi:hypothetical protein
MSQDHEYMDTGALTPDAVPEPAQVPQPPVEAPGSPAEQADEQTEAPDVSANQATSLPPGAFAEAKPQE